MGNVEIICPAHALVATTLLVFNVYNSKQALPSGKTHKVVNPPNTEKGFRFSPSHSPKKVSITDKTKKSQTFLFLLPI